MTFEYTIKKRVPTENEEPCPYDGVAYNKVPGYIEGYGCPVCKGIGPYHLPIPKTVAPDQKPSEESS